MKIVSYDDEVIAGILQKFPYPFCAEYAAFERKRGFQYFVLSDDAAQIFIPLKVSKRQIFHVGIFTHAPLTATGSLSPEKEKEFLTEACNFCSTELKCIRIEPGSTISVFSSFPEGAKSIELGLFTVDLTKTEEDVFAAFNSTYRNEIRGAEKSEIEIRYGKNEIAAFYECYADTHKRQYIAHENKKFFEDMYAALDDDKVICATAWLKNALEAGVFLTYTPYAGYYLYAGSVAKTQLKGSTKKILWDCMKLMKQRGVAKFVLGGARHKNVQGTKYEGIQNFKRRFGSEVTDGFIWKKDLNPAMCALYDFLFWAKCTMKGTKVPKDIIDSQL